MRQFSLILAALVSACGSMGVYDGEFRYLGVIERTSKVSRAGDPSKLLMAFGVIGGAIYGSTANSTYLTNFYVVKTIEGEAVSAQTDNEFIVGDCVEVIPTKDALRWRAYGYGDARVVRSTKCTPSNGQPIKEGERQ